MHTYTIKNDAVSGTYSAETADDAVAKFASEEGYKARTLEGLSEEVERKSGVLYVHEDGVLIAMVTA